MNEINEKVSEDFRKQPNKRWDGSYSKRVHDCLQAFWSGKLYGGHVKAAQDLLRDYHDTMHVVYEERDQARNDLKTATEKLNSSKNALRFPNYPITPPLVSFSDWERIQKERDEARAARKLAEEEVDRAARTTNDYRELFLQKCKHLDAAATELTEARAAVSNLAKERTGLKAELEAALKGSQSVKQAQDDFRKRVKDALKNALITSGVL